MGRFSVFDWKLFYLRILIIILSCTKILACCFLYKCCPCPVTCLMYMILSTPVPLYAASDIYQWCMLSSRYAWFNFTFYFHYILYGLLIHVSVLTDDWCLCISWYDILWVQYYLLVTSFDGLHGYRWTKKLNVLQMTFHII